MLTSRELLEKMTIPYYAHSQAKIAPALPSIAWNKVALSGYLDLCLLFKNVEIPSSYLRKIRKFYEHYEQIANFNPILGELDPLSRNLTHLDKANPKAVLTFALKWNTLVQAIEEYCYEIISQLLINEPEQIASSLQRYIYQMQEERDLPRWNDLLEQQQSELAKIVQIKNLSTATFAKINYKHQFNAKVYTDQPWLESMLKTDPEIAEHFFILNKSFLRLVNLINEKLPEPERHLKVSSNLPDPPAPSPDYRLSVNYYYTGNDAETAQPNFFSLIRNILK